jgi:hypothetical protein
VFIRFQTCFGEKTSSASTRVTNKRGELAVGALLRN